MTSTEIKSPHLAALVRSIDIYDLLCVKFEAIQRTEKTAMLDWIKFMIQNRFCLISEEEGEVTGVLFFRPCVDFYLAGTNDRHFERCGDSVWIDLYWNEIPMINFAQAVWRQIGRKKFVGFCRNFNGQPRFYSVNRMQHLLEKGTKLWAE